MRYRPERALVVAAPVGRRPLGCRLRAARWAVAFVAAWPLGCPALPVPIRAVEASVPSRQGFPLEAAVDGVVSADNGWSVQDGSQFSQQKAVFATAKPLTAAFCQCQFSFLDSVPGSHFGDFEVAVTTDEQPTVAGRWIPLIPELTLTDFPDGVRPSGARIRIATNYAVSVVTVRARVPFAGITGFRLKLFVSDPGRGRPPSVGRSDEGSFVLTEFRVEISPERSSNLALGRQVYCSRAVAPGLPSRNLTDGFFSTYSHPDPQTGGAQAFFELDLGQMIPLDHIVVRGREDGPEDGQLGAYRVRTFTEPVGSAWQTQWESRQRADGSPLPLGGADVIRARDGEGVFSGRRIRIYNESGRNPQPQISEAEVYPALFPRAQDWLADDRVLSVGTGVAAPAGAQRLRFTIVCGKFGELASSLIYRWRLVGWKDDWQETDANGAATISPAPPPGLFKLEVQTRHSDGVWDESGLPVSLSVALPWWRNPPLVAAVMFVALVLVAAVWWRVKAAMMKRRLALAEQHLDLHRERLRIARDMHDDMGARLTYLALLADRSRREADAPPAERDSLLSDLAEGARSSVNALDAIVWAVNPQHDTVGDLADYLSDYAPAYVKVAGVECRLDLHVETPKHPLGLTLRHSLLMAVKEALQNVVRHADATTVRLALREAQGRLEISVTDDGRGVREEPAGVNHSGLENMRQRLAEAGGVCEISAGEDGRGTRVRFTMPLNHRK